MADEFDFSPEELENSISGMEQVDEFNTSIDYDNFIVLAKKDLANFCRVVEPLTKQSIDEYGKCVYYPIVTGKQIGRAHV